MLARSSTNCKYIKQTNDVLDEPVTLPITVIKQNIYLSNNASNGGEADTTTAATVICTAIVSPIVVLWIYHLREPCVEYPACNNNGEKIDNNQFQMSEIAGFSMKAGNFNNCHISGGTSEKAGSVFVGFVRFFVFWPVSLSAWWKHGMKACHSIYDQGLVAKLFCGIVRWVCR